MPLIRSAVVLLVVVALAAPLARVEAASELPTGQAAIGRQAQPNALPVVELELGTDETATERILTITVTATDDGGLERIELAADRDDDPEFSQERRFECGGERQCSNTWAGNPALRGRYRLVARAIDDIGQVAEATLSFNVAGRGRIAAIVRRPPPAEPPAPSVSEPEPDAPHDAGRDTQGTEPDPTK